MAGSPGVRAPPPPASLGSYRAGVAGIRFGARILRMEGGDKMCLGIPGQLTEFVDPGKSLAKVDVSGVTRTINVALLEGEPLEIGDWVLIHVGFAMSRIDEEEAEEALASLQLLGQAYADELESLASSPSSQES